MRYFVFIVAILFSNIEVYARWANYEDASIEFKYYNSDHFIHKDGTSESIIETRQKILKEDARSALAEYVIFYNANSSEIKIIEAKTFTDNKEYIVTNSMIEDKPVASNRAGFDETRQIKISFPKIELNSEIYLKYSLIETKPILKDFYGATFFFGIEGYWNHSSLKIKSEIPLNIKVNDPSNLLKITNINDDQNNQNLNITLSKPYFCQIINEPLNARLAPENMTFISISTLNDFKELANKMSLRYEAVIDQKLPKIFQQIVDDASKINNEIDQINFVTSKLNEKVQYFGDWRSIDGQMFPRDLEKIAESQLGDCKDFSVSAGSILKKLGYKVDVGLIKRGVGIIELEDSIPLLERFNHAFLKIIGKKDIIYWIDPTNVVSMAGGIFPDIANKHTLILNSANPTYEITPNIDPSKSKHMKNIYINVLIDKVNIFGDFKIIGESALFFTGAKLFLSDRAIRDYVFRMLSNTDLPEENKKDLKITDLSSRIVEDIDMKYEYFQDNLLVTTSLGEALKINYRLNAYIDISQDQISDLFIDNPCSVIERLVIKNMNIENIESFNYDNETPWIYIKREAKYNDKDTEIFSEIRVKKSFIKANELKSTQYKALKKDLEKNFKDPLVILRGK